MTLVARFQLTYGFGCHKKNQILFLVSSVSPNPEADLPTPPDPIAKSSADEQLASVARPKQARSEQTLRRILEAAERLIGEKGLGDVSIPDIVREARSSVGGFYARFKDKNELLRALEERFFQRLDGKSVV